MVSSTPILENFIESVPTCGATDSLAVVWSIFRFCGRDRVVIINEEQNPLGFLSLRGLLSVSGDFPEGSGHWQKGLWEWEKQLVEPLLELPGHWTLRDFCSYLENEEQQQINVSSLPPPEKPIALVNSQGQFMGLLDSLRIFKFLALHPQVALPSPSSPPWLEQLEKLLEVLPLPVQLQTTTGEILYQNHAWSAQIGSLSLSPQTSRPKESTLKESPVKVSPQGATLEESPKNRGVWEKAPMDSYQSSPEYSPIIAHPSECRPAGKPDTYICINPSQTGTERVWQFIKQPLGRKGDIFHLIGDSHALDDWQSHSFFSSNFPSFLPPHLWLVLAQDLTEQDAVARELVAKNADLIQLNRLKDEFLACITHELKTPLTAILGLSTLLQDKVFGTLSPRQARYAHLIHQSGRHLMMVVNDILDLTRIETGQLELILEPVDIPDLCETAKRLALAENQSSESPSPDDSGDSPAPIPFTLDIEPSLTTIVADLVRLRQILVNLLSNALKFTEVGGSLGLKVSRWESWIAFTVWDTGIGIPLEQQHLLFQKFQQLESPLNRRFQGTGLGLVLTQRLARLHGGDVFFMSKEGEGSSFTVLLPPCPPTVSKDELSRMIDEWGDAVIVAAKSPPVGIGESRLVLIVEAVPKAIESWNEQLSGLGYRVLIARSGTEALDKARRFRPALIFLNPLLPLLSGWDVLTVIKTDRDIHQIPVIVTASRGEKEKALLYRADGFLTVPVQLEALQELLNDLMSNTQLSMKKTERLLTLLWLSPLLDNSQKLLEESSNLDDSPESETPRNRSWDYDTSEELSLIQHLYQCRVLEAQDLDQAELLAKIWKPDVLLLNSQRSVIEPATFITQLCQCKSLASLPLVTLDPITTHAANQIPSLSVFPYLRRGRGDVDAIAASLLQVIELAAGVSLQPTVLVVDLSNLLEPPKPIEKSLGHRPLSPMIQYLERGGLRGLIGRSWAEVLQQLQCQSVDVLILYINEETLPKDSENGESESRSPIGQMFSSLSSITPKPPILILNGRLTPPGEKLKNLGKELGAKILPLSLSMAELLEEIKRVHYS